MRNNPVIAIATADIHLSHTPPIARAGELDQPGGWYGAMKRVLEQVCNLQHEHRNVPVLIAGDLFHHWKAPPELINFAIANLPHSIIAIPGQHDLPNHSIEELHKSAYGTLQQANIIKTPKGSSVRETLRFYGFPWGCPVKPPQCSIGIMNVCLHHAYTWFGANTAYTDAPNGGEITKSNIEKYRGYHTVITGDNHQSFCVMQDDIQFYNPGSLMRRNSDQIDHRPQVGLLHADGTIIPHYLDCSKDVISSKVEPIINTPTISLKRLQEQLKQLQGSTLDFVAVMRQTMEREDVSTEVRQFIEQAIGEKEIS